MSEQNNELEIHDERSKLEKIANRISSISYLQSVRSFLSREKKIAVIVDAPNFLRKVKNKQVKLDDIEDKIKDEGKIVIRKVLLNEFASESLLQAVFNSGYEPIVAAHDIYIQMAIEVTKLLSEKIDLIFFATRHARAVPIVQKLKERAQQLFEDLNENPDRLNMELSLLAERYDITEECVRMKSHIKLFLDALENEEEAGRKLNFILQEMNREANTINSKTISSEISHKGIFIKENIVIPAWRNIIFHITK